MGPPATSTASRRAFPSSDGLQFARVTGIGDAYRDCSDHSDCFAVEVTCSGCCTDGAVARAHRAQYDRAFAQACSTYRGGICMCGVQPELVPRCVDDACVLIERSEIDD